MGSEHIMLGSDFPYPLGERPAGNLIRQAEFLTNEQQRQMLGGNAQQFLGIDSGVTMLAEKKAAS
jgi:aminocarboxymuconate-semialdehyde decarboxylase